MIGTDTRLFTLTPADALAAAGLVVTFTPAKSNVQPGDGEFELRGASGLLVTGYAASKEKAIETAFAWAVQQGLVES